MGARFTSVAAMGDVQQIHTWSGIPYHFLQAAQRQGFASHGISVDTTRERVPRILWNLKELCLGRKGGFQYSPWHLGRLEAQLTSEELSSDVLTFHQHFPRHQTLERHHGTLSHYVDAPFAALAHGQGLQLNLPKKTVARAMRIEETNYLGSQRIVTMAKWAAQSICDHYPGVPSEKIHTILPGANLDLPEDWQFRSPTERASLDYDLVLGFVGKDWERKGLALLLEVQNELQRRGHKVLLRVAGKAPASLAGRPDVEFSGFIDKRMQASEFAHFVASCDIGCLFSRREALGISTLEFLRLGVPVAGFAHEGPADTLPKTASLRFDLHVSIDTIVDGFERFIQDLSYAQGLRSRAIALSPLVTWDRCVQEMAQLWKGTAFQPLQLWEL